MNVRRGLTRLTAVIWVAGTVAILAFGGVVFGDDLATLMGVGWGEAETGISSERIRVLIQARGLKQEAQE